MGTLHYLRKNGSKYEILKSFHKVVYSTDDIEKIDMSLNIYFREDDLTAENVALASNAHFISLMSIEDPVLSELYAYLDVYPLAPSEAQPKFLSLDLKTWEFSEESLDDALDGSGEATFLEEIVN